ncbi:hypothetical protein F5Y11DRAFT_250175 [Daldinia sp. FL1419]|nr:hypothetical protein F5Y11DRAFT_250175 [Daldinia sp. FL1419]
MRISILTTAALCATTSLSRPWLSLGTLPAVTNWTSFNRVGGPTYKTPRPYPPDPVRDDSYCRQDTAPGTNLTQKEKKPMLECYDKMLRGSWFNEWTHCNGTDRYFQSWGTWWKEPDDCYNAVRITTRDQYLFPSPLALLTYYLSQCKRCFNTAIIANSANWYCFQTAGFMAQCNVRYMQSTWLPESEQDR